MFVSQLNIKAQNKIKYEVRKALYELGLDEEFINEGVELAMNSKLLDLKETINIKEYLNEKAW